MNVDVDHLEIFLSLGIMGYTIIKKLKRSKSRTKWVKNWLLRKDLHHMKLLKVLEDGFEPALLF